MRMESRDHHRLDVRLATLLGAGTWVACALVAVGLLMPLLGFPRLGSISLVTWGTVLLMTLPVLRVAVMAMWFLKHREVDFAAIACLVLLVIVVATFLGAGAA
jgi:hypothetical protein